MRTKIDYGIDLGTTNSAIARMENGTPKVVKIDSVNSDTMPSCVNINRKGIFDVGVKVINAAFINAVHNLKSFRDDTSDTYREFKRTMGTSVGYKSVNLGRDIMSKELSAQVLKSIKEYVVEENLDGVVITVPAKFSDQQCEDTIRAAKSAGFKQVRLLQEPVAAATAYGLKAGGQSAYWLVFDFGGGTFDAALVKSEDGILSVKDTEGDNFLGGKNLDEKIVDEILIPYLESHYDYGYIINDKDNRRRLTAVLKFWAEDIKKQMSFKNEYNFVSDLGYLPEDSNGEEPEIDITVTSAGLEKVIAPVFQKAVDITKELLKRNNLSGGDLDRLVLVGGPTFSPILRKMLKEQITEKVDTSVDPMTVVAVGAALFASTVDLSEDIQNKSRDITKLQLEVKYESSSAEETELVNIKMLPCPSCTDGSFTAELKRADGAWTSPKVPLSQKPFLLEVSLEKHKNNIFNISVYDKDSNSVECEPAQFSILQGISGLANMEILPYHIGIIKDFDGGEGFQPCLEKGKRYPTIGVLEGLKVSREVKAGSCDELIVPVYEGDYDGAGGDKRLYNKIYNVIISGKYIPETLRENEPVDLKIKADENRNLTLELHFPRIDYTYVKNIERQVIEIPETEELYKAVKDGKEIAGKLEDYKAEDALDLLEQDLNNANNEKDRLLAVQSSWRRIYSDLSKKQNERKLPELQEELEEELDIFESLLQSLKSGKLPCKDESIITEGERRLEKLKLEAESVCARKDIKKIKELISKINAVKFVLIARATDGFIFVKFIEDFNRDFASINWTNPGKARELINTGLTMIRQNDRSRLPDLYFEICELMPAAQRPNLLK